MLEEEQSHTSTKQKIEAWLEAEGITFEPVSDLNSHFHIVVNLKNVQVPLERAKGSEGRACGPSGRISGRATTLEGKPDQPRRQALDFCFAVLQARPV